MAEYDHVTLRSTGNNTQIDATVLVYPIYYSQVPSGTEDVVIEPCTISQTITFGGVTALVGGREIDAQEWPPFGLDPFVNGTFRSMWPISSTTVVYETTPECMVDTGGEDPGEGTPTCSYPTLDDPEYHIVAWQPITLTPIFDVPECVTPTLDLSVCPQVMENTPVRESEPSTPGNYYNVIGWLIWLGNTVRVWYKYFIDWWIYLVTFWFTWLWCRLQAMLFYTIGWINYGSCMGQAMTAIVANGITEYIYNIYLDLGEQFSGLIYVLVSFFDQLGFFLQDVAVPEVSAWLEEMLNCAADHLDSWLPAYTSFMEMAISELTPWTMDLLNWFADDFVSGTWSQLLNLISAVIENSSATMLFLTAQFAATILDLVNMMGFGLKIVIFVVDLALGIVVGLQAALNAETQADIFLSATFFWRGVELFEDLIGGTPLVFLNVIASGLMGIRVLPWTLDYLRMLVTDLMEAVGK